MDRSVTIVTPMETSEHAKLEKVDEKSRIDNLNFLIKVNMVQKDKNKAQ